MNEKYSYGDFALEPLFRMPAAEFDGEIIGSCFQQDELDTFVFPDDARATFLRCNLNNCEIPVGCTVGTGSVNYQHAKQNDNEQWVLDEDGKPTTPLNLKVFERYGLSQDPKNIPAEPMPPKTSVTIKAAKKKGAVERIAMIDEEKARLQADHNIPASITPE